MGDARLVVEIGIDVVIGPVPLDMNDIYFVVFSIGALVGIVFLLWSFKRLNAHRVLFQNSCFYRLKSSIHHQAAKKNVFHSGNKLPVGFIKNRLLKVKNIEYVCTRLKTIKRCQRGLCMKLES